MSALATINTYDLSVYCCNGLPKVNFEKISKFCFAFLKSKTANLDRFATFGSLFQADLFKNLKG